MLLLACQSGAHGGAQTPVAVKAQIAQRCPEVLPLQGPLNLTQTRLYVEVALLTEVGPKDSQFEGRSSEVTSVMQFIATPEVPTTMPWGDCLDAACDSRNARITLTAKFSTAPTQPVAVQMLVEQLPHSVTESPTFAPQQVDWQSVYKKTLQLHDQQPMVLDDPEHALGNGETVVTGYVLTRPKDLFRLMACKANQVGTNEIRPVSARPQ